MTYTELEKSINVIPDPDLKAWRVLKLFKSRKGFNDFWNNADDIDRDEIFDDLRQIVNHYY